MAAAASTAASVVALVVICEIHDELALIVLVELEFALFRCLFLCIIRTCHYILRHDVWQ